MARVEKVPVDRRTSLSLPELAAITTWSYDSLRHWCSDWDETGEWGVLTLPGGVRVSVFRGANQEIGVYRQHYDKAIADANRPAVT